MFSRKWLINRLDHVIELISLSLCISCFNFCQILRFKLSQVWFFGDDYVFIWGDVHFSYLCYMLITVSAVFFLGFSHRRQTSHEKWYTRNMKHQRPLISMKRVLFFFLFSLSQNFISTFFFSLEKCVTKRRKVLEDFYGWCRFLVSICRFVSLGDDPRESSSWEHNH